MQTIEESVQILASIWETRVPRIRIKSKRKGDGMRPDAEYRTTVENTAQYGIEPTMLVDVTQGVKNEVYRPAHISAMFEWSHTEEPQAIWTDGSDIWICTRA